MPGYIYVNYMVFWQMFLNSKRDDDIVMIKRFLIFLIRIYRRYFSLLKGRPSCIYYPTCSWYAIEALEKHGLIKGSYLAVRRVLRCHPYGRGGYDPVPETRRKK